MEQSDSINLTLSYLVDTWNDLVKCLSQNSSELSHHQLNYWQDYLKLQHNFSLSPDEHIDKRFKYQEWQENVLFNFIKQSYLLISRHIKTTIADLIKNEDEAVARKLQFLSQQLIDAMAPTNFANLNPEVLAKITETNGENLLSGYKNLLEDMQQGRSLFNIKLTDTNSFKLGDNIGFTPGKVVFQNDVMQLIQYNAATESVYQYPLLIIPPWINKYYILDLQPENSLVKWLVDQGITVFMISWVNASSKQRDKQFSDYMHEGPLAALKVMQKITGKKKSNVLGYCIGGTLLSCTLAYLAQKNNISINSATFLTTLLDFSEPGELGTFSDEKQISIIEKMMVEKGYFDGNIMGAIFNSLRVNDLIWSAFVNQYLKGQKPKPFDLLYWNSDATNIPEHVHSYYLRNMYLENNLIQRGKMIFSGMPIDLGLVTTPSYFLAAQDDHIAPWMSCFKSQQYFAGIKKFVLTTSGHVAGVINPPRANKYGYWDCDKNISEADKYLAKAVFHKGSWWPDWMNWLKQYSGEMRLASELKASKKIEDAPGSYVRVTLADIM